MSISSISNIGLTDLPVKDILKALVGVFKIPDVPPPPIDPLTVLNAAANPGLSPRKISQKVLSRQAEACAPFGPMPSGEENIYEKMEYIRVEEIVKAIQQDMKISVSVPPGITSIGFITMPPLPPIPVISYTVTPAHPAVGAAQ